MKRIKDMTNQELFDEYVSYDQLINDVGCYGTRDLRYFSMLEVEVQRRELRIRKKLILEEDEDD